VQQNAKYVCRVLTFRSRPPSSATPNCFSSGSVTALIESTDRSKLSLVMPVSVKCRGRLLKSASGMIASRNQPMLRVVPHSCSIRPPTIKPGFRNRVVPVSLISICQYEWNKTDCECSECCFVDYCTAVVCVPLCHS
jgi:hypothetical protein